MPTRVTPIFLFSLPRAGSTLLQRMLAAQPSISTSAETWLLLPLLYALRQDGMEAEYQQRIASQALREFCGRLPDGEGAYRRGVRELALSLYEQAASSGTKYFVDKTPRYHLIAPEIMEMFPDAKFVFLWRNPLAVAGSMIETFGNGKWNLFQYRLDLYQGLVALLEAHRMMPPGRAFAVRYEDLLENLDASARSLSEYLEIPYEPAAWNNFSSVRLEGNLGDPTGTRKYSAVSTEPLDKWKATFSNPIRRTWARRYVQWIGEERLAMMGYSEPKLLEQLEDVGLSLQDLVADTRTLARRGLRRFASAFTKD